LERQGDGTTGRQNRLNVAGMSQRRWRVQREVGEEKQRAGTTVGRCRHTANVVEGRANIIPSATRMSDNDGHGR